MTSVTDNFMKYERMEGRVLTIDGAEFADTREKLEADVRMTLNDSDDWHAWVQYNTALEWLDRQAAITKSEWAHVHDMYIADLRKERDEAERKIRELRDELAHLPKTADECEACQDAHDRLMYSSGERIKELEAERDHMQRVIQAQAESFRKLEAQSVMPADCTDCKHLDELRALRRRIRKLARFAGLLD